MDSTNGYSAESVSPQRREPGTAASLRMAGPRDSQPNELDHEISFACSIASAMCSGSLRTKRKGEAEKGLIFRTLKTWED